MKKWLLVIILVVMTSTLTGFMYIKEKRPWMLANGTPILMYHAISEAPQDTPKNSKGWYVTEQQFEEQMQYLKENGYTLLTFEEFDEVEKYEKPIFITLDDGYADNMNALRILEKLEDDKFKPKATLFMVADFVNKPNYLSAEQLKEMSDSGILSIQSHTSTHVDSTGIDVNYQVEYKESKDKLEAITKKPVDTLCYPHGKFNDKAVEEAKKNYKYAVIMGHDRFNLMGEENELYTLERLTVSGSDSMWKFKLMVR
jgi:peptidoglycan/xylan/chitin deacetylase (PgdA/CDA1 family)